MFSGPPRGRLTCAVSAGFYVLSDVLAHPVHQRRFDKPPRRSCCRQRRKPCCCRGLDPSFGFVCAHRPPRKPQQRQRVPKHERRHDGHQPSLLTLAPADPVAPTSSGGRELQPTLACVGVGSLFED